MPGRVNIYLMPCTGDAIPKGIPLRKHKDRQRPRHQDDPRGFAAQRIRTGLNISEGWLLAHALSLTPVAAVNRDQRGSTAYHVLFLEKIAGRHVNSAFEAGEGRRVMDVDSPSWEAVGHDSLDTGLDTGY